VAAGRWTHQWANRGSPVLKQLPRIPVIEAISPWLGTNPIIQPLPSVFEEGELLSFIVRLD